MNYETAVDGSLLDDDDDEGDREIGTAPAREVERLRSLSQLKFLRHAPASVLKDMYGTSLSSEQPSLRDSGPQGRVQESLVNSSLLTSFKSNDHHEYCKFNFNYLMDDAHKVNCHLASFMISIWLTGIVSAVYHPFTL